MPRKQVEGHTSHQAPATRQIYTNYVFFIKFERGGTTYTKDVTRALKWYNNGNTVSAVIRRKGFIIDRPQLFEKTSTSDYSAYDGMFYTEHDKTYRTWRKKWNQHPTEYELNYLADINLTQVQINSF